MTDIPNDPGDDKPPRPAKPKAPSRYANAPYERGKGKPPVEHRFKPGGKPGPGRPKGSRNRSHFGKMLDTRIKVGVDSLGRPKYKTWRQITDLKLMELVAKNEISAIKLAKEIELKEAELERRFGPRPPSIEEMKKQIEEEAQRKISSEKTTKYMIEMLDFAATLKRYGLTEFVDGVPRFTEHGKRTLAQGSLDSTEHDDRGAFEEGE